MKIMPANVKTNARKSAIVRMYCSYSSGRSHFLKMRRNAEFMVRERRKVKGSQPCCTICAADEDVMVSMLRRGCLDQTYKNLPTDVEMKFCQKGSNFVHSASLGPCLFVLECNPGYTRFIGREK